VRGENRRCLPRTGIPEAFASYRDYRAHVDLLVRTGCIDQERRLWWDLRRSPRYETVEIRICDMPTRLEHTVAVVALTQALVAELLAQHRAGAPWSAVPSCLIEENRRRAVREGVRGRFADFSSGREVSTAAAIDELLALVEPAAIRLGIFEEVQQVRQIVETGTSADHQLKIYNQTRDPRAVVDWLLSETYRDLS
jgi:carboxylate-amine ligase